MKLGDKVILRENYQNYKKGDSFLYLSHCRCSGYPCLELIIKDEHYEEVLKNHGVYDLKGLINKNPLSKGNFNMIFNTLKPQVHQACLYSDLVMERDRLESKLNEVEELIELSKK